MNMINVNAICCLKIVKYCFSGGCFMHANFYEQHYYKKPSFPIIFHYDVLKRNSQIYFHWHENIEILYFTKGKGEVINGGKVYTVEETGMVVINANSIHSIRPLEEQVEYYCLIVDKNFCENLGFYVEERFIKPQIHDRQLNSFFDDIISEMNNKNSYYESAVLYHIAGMLLYLYRHYESVNEEQVQIHPQKTKMVKVGLRYIREHFHENISVDDIVSAVGFSKYYFLRTFKELTRNTVIHYLNTIRIQRACQLLAEQNISISEISSLCGFDSASYFTKVFKRYTGQLPSEYRHSLLKKQQ